MARTKSLLRKIGDGDPCLNFEPIHLGFLDSVGGVEFWTFLKETREVLEVTKNQFERTLEPDYEFGDRGRTHYSAEAKQVFTIKSDWISEYDYRYLDNLIKAIWVIWWRDGASWPILITTKTWEYKYLKLDKIFQATITFEPSWRINLDRL